MGGNRKNHRKPKAACNTSARQTRANEVVTDNLWVEVNQIHDGCREQLAQAAHLTALMGNREAVSRVKDKERLIEIGKLVQRDTRQIVEELNSIRSTHEERQKAYTAAHAPRDQNGMNAEEMLEAAQIGELYAGLQDRHMRGVLPNIIEGIAMFEKVDRPELPGVDLNKVAEEVTAP